MAGSEAGCGRFYQRKEISACRDSAVGKGVYVCGGKAEGRDVAYEGSAFYGYCGTPPDGEGRERLAVWKPGAEKAEDSAEMHELYHGTGLSDGRKGT